MANSSKTVRTQLNHNGPARNIEPPNVGPRYSQLKYIGAGVHGTLFSAIDEATTPKQQVAIKRISLHQVMQTDNLKRALYEIYILKRVRHPNIIAMTDLFALTTPGSQSRSAYIVLEYMPANLYQVIHGPLRSQMTNAHISQITCHILRGLEHLHSIHVIHRDLKPPNILVNGKCEAKICDFGLARVAHPVLYENKTKLTEKVVALGYRAPEITLTPGRYNQSMDIWSVGCIFFEMITGQILFPGKSDTDLVHVIVDVLGTPDAGQIRSLPDIEEQAEKFLTQLPQKTKQPWPAILGEQDANVYDFIESLLKFSPSQRATAANALQHPYLAGYREKGSNLSRVTPLTFDMITDGKTEQELSMLITEEINSFTM